MKTIGTARFSDYDKLAKWYAGLSIEAGRELTQDIERKLLELFPEFSTVRAFRRDTDSYIIYHMTKQMYLSEKQTCYGFDEAALERMEQSAWERVKKFAETQFGRYKMFSEDFGQPFNVGYWTDTFAYVYFGNVENGIVIPHPAEYLDYKPFPDRSNVSLPQLKAQLGVSGEVETSNWLPANIGGQEVTHAQLESLQQKQKKAQEELDEKVRQIKNCETKELAKMKAEIENLQAQLEVRKTELMLDLEDKIGDAEEKMNQLKAQLFMLESQIYAICCFAGETVDFIHVRSGQNAPDTEPVVVYQKLRFLDEDLGRMVSMYQLDWSKVHLFEEFLRHSPAALETFAPDKRCITLVRLSKTNRIIAPSNTQPYSNMLKEYEYFHGRTVGIIIRNGDNVYLGWTDEDRINIKDDFIISRVATEVSPGDVPIHYSDTPEDRLSQKRAERHERERQFNEKMQVLDGFVSRAFVFNILQGVVKNTSWLPLPPGETLTRPSIYVRYSLADMCLEDHRFSDFDQLIALANMDVIEGDSLLTMQYLRAHSGQYCHNDRGRGYADRTHDVSVEDCFIYKANLVEYDDPVRMVRYKFKMSTINGGTEWHVCTARATSKLSDDCVILGEYDQIDRHIFVSLEKSSNWSCSEVAPRANFELYQDEFINLAFMNSVWLTWAINTKNLGNWHVKSTEIIYAHAIRYLNTALDFVRKREEKEKEIIDAVDPDVCKNPEWPLLLSDWKFMLSQDKERRSVRNITPFQAKRFVKWVSDGMPGRKNFSKLPPPEEELGEFN